MEEGNEAVSILVLPEGCISEIISRTSPLDACRVSEVSKGFKSAADSDAVWERFLPAGYRQIIARAVSPVVFQTKKQLYSYLSYSKIRIDGGNVIFMFDKSSRKKCYHLGAMELSIARMDEYWERSRIPVSRFAYVGILKLVRWFEIRGKIATMMLSMRTTYAAYLLFTTSEHSGGLAAPAKTFVKFSGTETVTTNVCLQHPLDTHGRCPPMQEYDRFPRMRMDGWMEIELGEFFTDEEDHGELEMVLEDGRYRNWKRGLIVEGIELRPK